MNERLMNELLHGHRFLAEYMAEVGGAFEIKLDQVMVNDGMDIIVLRELAGSGNVTSGTYLFQVVLGYEPNWDVVSFPFGNPTNVTYGGLDRPSIFDYDIPRIIEKPTRLALVTLNVSKVVVRLILAHMIYVNRARRASVLVGGTNIVKPGLAWRDSYSDASGAEVEKSKIDLGAVFNVRKLAVRLSAYVSESQTGSQVTIYVSSDGSTWTKVWESNPATSSLPTTSTEYYATAENLKFRYLSIRLNSASTAVTAYLTVTGPAFIWA